MSTEAAAVEIMTIDSFFSFWFSIMTGSSPDKSMMTALSIADEDESVELGLLLLPSTPS